MTKPTLTIEYCEPCSYLARTLWQVQELLSVLAGDIGTVELIPADKKGRYRVTLSDQVLFSKELEGRFPEPKELLEAAFAALGQSKP